MPAPEGNKYAEGNEGGRPSKFTEKTIEIAKSYLSEYSLDEAVPTFQGLAMRLDVSVDTLTNWKNENEEFFGVYEKIRAEQGKMLINGGLTNKLNSNIVKLLLGKHGFSDKQELLGKDGEKLDFNVIQFKDHNNTV